MTYERYSNVRSTLHVVATIRLINRSEDKSNV